MAIRTRDAVSKGLTFLAGLYFALEFFLPQTAVDALGISAAHESISYGFVTVGAVALLLGIFNLLSFHGRKISNLRPGWWASATLLVGLGATIGIGGLDWYQNQRNARDVDLVRSLGVFAYHIDHTASPLPLVDRARLWSGECDRIVTTLRSRLRSLPRDASSLNDTITELQRATSQFESKSSYVIEHINPLKEEILRDFFQKEDKKNYDRIADQYSAYLRGVAKQSLVSHLNAYIFEGLFNSLDAAMFSLLAVYIAAAAFRAFRVRSVESALMMASACIVILGQTSAGVALSEAFPVIRLWLLEVPSSAAFRGIKIGAALAGLVMAFRIWISLESSTFSRDGNAS
jgi:hypothetical protein